MRATFLPIFSEMYDSVFSQYYESFGPRELKAKWKTELLFFAKGLDRAFASELEKLWKIMRDISEEPYAKLEKMRKLSSFFKNTVPLSFQKP